MKRCLIPAGVILLCSAVFAAPQRPPLIPVETLFAEPAIAGLSFSPNGRYIVCRIPHNGRMNLGLVDLEKMEKKLLTALPDQDIQSASWANNETIVFTADPGGHENPYIYAIKRDGSDAVTLREGGDRAGANSKVYGILARLENDPKHILVEAGVGELRHPDVCRMNLVTGNLDVVVPNPGKVDTWVLDRDNNVRIGVVRDRTHYQVITRPVGSIGDWKVIEEYDDGTPHWEPVAFDGDGKTLFVASDIGRKTVAIYRYDLERRQLGEIVVADDTYDVTSIHDSFQQEVTVIYDRSRKKVTGFTYNADKPKTVWIDAQAEAFHKKVDAAYAGYFNTIVSVSDDGTKTLIFSRNDRDRGVYSLFDSARKRLEELAVVQPALDPNQMAKMQPVAFTVRDGLEVHGYLTLPVGREPKNLPLVVHPHGGPYGPRDNWGFNPEVQFYANRGFAVLQVNYRGSGGYGLQFLQAGYKKWGREMQNDLTDGVKWAIAQGIADPARVVISGASYGGYATMAGLTFTPELYCAGINYVGVTDLVLRARSMSRSLDGKQWHDVHLGDVDDAEVRRRLDATSPVNFADRIHVPLLMGYGKNDPRVNIEHCYAMERALKRAGKPYDLVVQEDEGHGFRTAKTRIDFYQKIDAFLTANVLRPGEVLVGPEKVVDMPAKTGAKK